MPSFSATGTMSVKGTAPDGKSGGLQIDMRVQHRDRLTRIDVLHITSLSTDQNANPLLAQLLPKGTIGVVIDQSKSLMTIWSTAHSLYYQTKLALPKAVTKHASKSGTSIWTTISNGLTSMTQYDSYSSSMDLTGHKTVNGHMASVFAFSNKSQKHGQKPQSTTGTFALADDLHGIPLHVDVSASAGALASATADLTQVTTTPPATTAFAIPKGYKKTTQLMQVLLDVSTPSPAAHTASAQLPH